jgi:hypothetical protein
MKALIRVGVVVCLLALNNRSLAQPRVDPSNRYERVIAVVPLIGNGTRSDPKRPKYAPAPHEINPASLTDIVGYKYLASDDGHFALVEFTARTRTGLQSILNDRSIQSFLKGRDKRQDIEPILKRFKKDFDWDKFVGRMR